MEPCLPAIRRVLGWLDIRFAARSSTRLMGGTKATSEPLRNPPRKCPRLRRFDL